MTTGRFSNINHPLVIMINYILSRLIYLAARILSFTYRYRYIGVENLGSSSHILGIWHQNLLQGILAQNDKHYTVIISKSKDADPVAFTCRRLGHIVYRGSSRSKTNVDKGGKEAKDQMIETLKLGTPGAVTVDGPKGPAREVKPGIIDMAMKANIPIIPYLPIPEKFWTLKSWDKFRIPKPFTRIAIFYDKPIHIDEGIDFSIYQERLKKALNEKESKAVSLFKVWKTLSKNN